MNLSDIKKTTLENWRLNYPPPEYYDFELSTKPHPFMTLDKFISGHFHQFRVLKSYLAAHQSWKHSPLSTNCPRCHKDDEHHLHALLECPSRSTARAEYIPELSSVEDIWKSPSNIIKVCQYLRATKTA
jgi:hypothetical protein